MLASVSSCLGWNEDLPRDPRSPESGSQPTVPERIWSAISDGVEKASNSFMFHIPDLRHSWKSERAWLLRDHQRLEMNRQPHPSCNGMYLALFSFAADDLRKNTSVPRFMGTHRTYWGDVFIVKLGPHEFGNNAWATYEDMSPEFLELRLMDPSFQPVFE